MVIKHVGWPYQTAALWLSLAWIGACSDGGDPVGDGEDSTAADAADRSQIEAVTPDSEASDETQSEELTPGGDTRQIPDIGPLPETIHVERPAAVVIPDEYDGTTPTPLLILLHGYGASAAVQNFYLGVSEATRTAGFLLVLPDGTVDPDGMRFWNATPACCDFYGEGIDDVAYLGELLELMAESFNVDTDRVYLFGHSNGGFMSYRMACESAERITAIASLAGSTWASEGQCVNPDPVVSVLQIHGTQDDTIPYDGLAGGYPSAPDTVARWAGRSGCDLEASTEGESFSLEVGLDGEETTVRRYQADCAADRVYELWTIEDGSHIPIVEADFAHRVLDWLGDHTR